MNPKSYLRIAEHYEQCFEKHGDNHRGVDWPDAEDAQIRYRVMLELIKPTDTKETMSILDFGCGTSHLYEYMLDNNLTHFRYSGLDVSQRFIDVSRKKFPHIDYYCADILNPDVEIPTFDYIVMNGVFTEKRELSFDEMWAFFQAVVRRVYPKARRGIAFNVMSKQVDWERDDLFHLPLDTLAYFLTKEISRDFVLRFDYGLYEYTCYAYPRKKANV